MRSIGIRVSPSEIFYTILEKHENGDFQYTNEVLAIPKALYAPRQLSYIRTTIFSLICEYHITRAGMRTTETISPTISVFRLNVEGVVQELFSNSTVQEYFTGPLGSMSSLLGSNSKVLKECYKDGVDVFNVDDWSSMKSSHRESYLAALAAMNL